MAKILLKIFLCIFFTFTLFAENKYQTCRNCGYNENAIQDRYCQECGSPLAEKITCPFCGSKNHVGDEYCLNCLKALKGKTFLDQVRSVKEKMIKEKEAEEALAISAENLDERSWAESTANILLALKNRDYQSAIKSSGQSLAKAKKTFGEDHPKTADSLSILAYIHFCAGNYDYAIDLYKESITLLETVFSKNSPETQKEKISLALTLIKASKKTAAAKLIKTIKQNDENKEILTKLNQELTTLPPETTPAKKK